jgi:hypothetical protein
MAPELLLEAEVDSLCDPVYVRVALFVRGANNLQARSFSPRVRRSPHTLMVKIQLDREKPKVVGNSVATEYTLDRNPLRVLNLL